MKQSWAAEQVEELVLEGNWRIVTEKVRGALQVLAYNRITQRLIVKRGQTLYQAMDLIVAELEKD